MKQARSRALRLPPPMPHVITCNSADGFHTTPLAREGHLTYQKKVMKMLIRCDRPFEAWEVGRSGAFYVTYRHPLYHEPGAFGRHRAVSYRGWDERLDR